MNTEYREGDTLTVRVRCVREEHNGLKVSPIGAGGFFFVQAEDVVAHAPSLHVGNSVVRANYITGSIGIIQGICHDYAWVWWPHNKMPETISIRELALHQST